MSTTEEEFLENICKILGHDLNSNPVDDDSNRMIINFEKTCSRCGRSGKATVKYSELMHKRFAILDKAHIKIDAEFNSSPHKKL